MEIRIPKAERLWTTYLNTNGEPIFVLTSKPTRDFYFLYEVKPDDSLVKLGKARSPTELEEKFNIQSRIHANS